MIAKPSPNDPARTATKVHMPDPDRAWASSTKNSPNMAPEASAMPSRRRLTARHFARGPALTKAIATTARTAPRSAIGPGEPSMTTPTTSGRAAAVTAVIGATTVMAPLDSPPYSSTMPRKPAAPEASPHARSVPAGAAPGRSTNANPRTGRHASWDTTVTASGRPRWLAFPPKKSPAPQTAAAPTASSTAAINDRYPAACDGRCSIRTANRR
jgi:hypothetical protein